ncbi:MAG: T9SS type A sorting domain-containing protein [Flavobacteriales bacterium]
MSIILSVSGSYRTAMMMAAVLSFKTAFTQTFLTPCSAPDSVVSMYRDDADRLSVLGNWLNGTSWLDSVTIDTSWSRAALNAMLAVHASDSPARDTVVDMLNIHIYPSLPLRSFYVVANAALPWMQQLQAGNIPTGTAVIDELLAAYGITLELYDTWLGGSSHLVVFNTAENQNLFALCAEFSAQSGVLYAELNALAGDGDQITDSVATDQVKLVYSHGWGDCVAGCGARRFWEFNVFFDCSVEFVGSYGSQLEIAMGVQDFRNEELTVYPNPVSDILFVDLSAQHREPSEWEIREATGRVVLRERTSDFPFSIPVGELGSGHYFLVMHGPTRSIVRPFVRE